MYSPTLRLPLRLVHPIRSIPSLTIFPRITTPTRRYFHPTLTHSASETNIDQLKSAFRSHPLYEKISKSEGALKAVKELGDVFQRKGINMTGEKPSMMDMAKWAMDTEIRTATTNIMVEFQKAGIDLSKENLTSLFDRSDKK